MQADSGIQRVFFMERLVSNTGYNCTRNDIFAIASRSYDLQHLFCFKIRTAIVTGITKSTNRHETILASVGDSDNFSVKTEEECKGEKFRNVVFCAPPSGFDDYPAAVKDVITNLWAGPSEGGAFIFTSSGGM